MNNISQERTKHFKEWLDNKYQIIPKDIRQTLYDIFELIQEPFEKYTPSGRCFLNYDYCVYKMLELLDKNDIYNVKIELTKYEDELWEKIIKYIS